MLSKLLQFIRQYRLIQPGDHVVCAVSGGADSVAMLWGMYLLRDKLGITLSAAHFNHNLRGAESERDEQFVKDLCARYDIALHLGTSQVTAGQKGLEAAAREARYKFLSSLPGKIATAHTADDNAETVLMHLLRGTGLKGLGGIWPARGRIIRPMLSVTRQQVLDFLQSYHLDYVQDSSNDSDAFLRNRLRHHVMPLLKQENPRLTESLSAMALGLREDEAILSALVQEEKTPSVSELRAMDSPQRARYLTAFLERNGIREPEREHILLAEKLVFSPKPSAKANFPGGVTVGRNYDALEIMQTPVPFTQISLPCPGKAVVPEGVIFCEKADKQQKNTDCFTVLPVGNVMIRCRQSGDQMRLAGGRKNLKKIYIDRKIPACQRDRIPVIADEQGILGVWGIGANLDRLAPDGEGIQIRFEKRDKSH